MTNGLQELYLYFSQPDYSISYRDKFADECAQFQATVIEDSKEMAALVEEKEALGKEMLNLEQKINTFRNSTTDYIAEILEEIFRSYSGK
jgi:cell division protein FtsB